MPWKEVDMMNLKEQFVLEAREKRIPFSRLCGKYEISRKTGYKWLKRFEDEGATGLIQRSRCPTRLKVTDEEWVVLILKTRDLFPAWGARKLRAYLANEGFENLPSESTFNRTLKRHHRIDQDDSAKRKPCIRFERSKPMELLQMDFKGHFSMENGRCHPLTVIDDHSRFALVLKACLGETGELVKAALTEAFQEYGLPDAMTMDNGAPWRGWHPYSQSQLKIWLMKLGIRVSHSTPYHPQTQGKDERFHRSLKEEVLRFNNFQNLEDAQEAFDYWRSIYNEKRPHEGIGLQRPIDRYQKSPRMFPQELPAVEYDEAEEVRKVQKNGVIEFMGCRAFVGEYLYKEPVAVRETTTDGIYDVYYSKTRLKSIDLSKLNKA